jgi:glycosyltransferase involved in cell wall biosynthesis
MSNTLVSVVLCTYNGDKFLAEQIDSILRQTYAPLELIISDDASSDSTREILKGYEYNPAIRIFLQDKNIGLIKNFAFTTEQARGELIAFSDQDDIWLEHKIESLVNAMGNAPLVYSDSLLVDEAGTSLNKKLSGLRKMYSGADSRGYILYSCVWGHGMLITKALLKKSSPMNEEIHHDIWLTFQAFLHGGIKYHGEILTHYRQHSSSSSITLPQKLPSRNIDQRYADYKRRLRWIEIVQQHERPEFQPFYQQLLFLYQKNEHQQYVFPLVGFMLKYRKEMFMLTRKNFFSHFIEILKLARGERKT